MSPRAFVSLIAAATLTLVAAIVLVVIEQVSARVQDAGGDPMFPDLVDRIDDLGQIVIETPRYRLVLEYRDNTWLAVALGDYPTDAEPVAEIIAALTAMTTVEPKTANSDWYDFIGVAGPGAEQGAVGIRITASATDGDVLADAIFGFESISIGFSRYGSTFVRRADEDQAWLVEGTIRGVPGFLQDWFEVIVHIPGPEVARVAILAGDEILLDAEKVDFNTADYELSYLSETVGPVGSTANDGGIRSVTQGVVSTSFDKTRPIEGVTFADDARTVRFVTRAGLQVDVTLGEADDEVWVAYKVSAEEGSEAVEEAQQIRARTENWAFQLPSYRMAALNRDLTELFVPPPEPAPDVVPPNEPLLPILP